MADPIGDSTGRTDVQGGRRPRHGARRPYRVEFSLTGQEFELLEAAAGRAGRALRLQRVPDARDGLGERGRRADGNAVAQLSSQFVSLAAPGDALHAG